MVAVLVHSTRLNTEYRSRSLAACVRTPSYLLLLSPAYQRSDRRLCLLVLCLTKPSLANTGALRDVLSTCLFISLFVCLFVRMSVKIIKLFARWQQLAASGGLSYRVRCTCL